MYLVDHLKKSVLLAERTLSKLDREAIGDVKGQSGCKNLCLMNNLCSSPNLNYLEIGLFNGLTFCCSLYNNHINAFGIDNWSEFNGSRFVFENNVKRFIGNNLVSIIEGDCFANKTKAELKEKLGDKKINIYLYDGGHSTEDHVRAITHYDEFMDDNFILVVDDWQQLEVQRGTFFALKEMKYDILYESHCRSVNDDVENWWCGTYVAVLRKI